MKKIILLLSVAIFALSRAAFAHHIWVEKEADCFKVGWGHPPQIDPYEPHRVKDIKAFDLKGKEITLKRIDGRDGVYLFSKIDVSIITLSFEGRYIVITPQGKKRLTKREAQKVGMHVEDSYYYSQFDKSLFGYSDTITKPVGMRFEIVPLKNPYPLKTDDLLSIKATMKNVIKIQYLALLSFMHVKF